jgi:hypothetical protein
MSTTHVTSAAASSTSAAPAGSRTPRRSGGATQSARRLARTAGVFYLVVAVLGGWAHGYVRGQTYVPGDAAATANNVVENASLVRLGFAADLVQAALMLFVVMALYVLLQHVNKTAARMMVMFVVVSVAITCLNMVFQLGSVLVAQDPGYAAAFGGQGSDGLVLLLLELQHTGYLIAQIFFGLWLFPLGLLAYRSGMFPRTIGVLLMGGTVAYLTDAFLQFLAPVVAATTVKALVPVVILAEVAMLAYLLIKGVKTPPSPDHSPGIPS